MRYHLDAKETLDHFKSFPKYDEINFPISSFFACDTDSDGEVTMQWNIQLINPQFKYSDILLRIHGNIPAAMCITHFINGEYKQVYDIWKQEYDFLERLYFEDLETDLDLHYFLRSFFTTPEMSNDEFKKMLGDIIKPK